MRNIVFNAIETAALPLGYSVYDGADSHAILIDRFPACRISSLQLVSATGRRERTAKYKATLEMIGVPDHADTSSETLQKLETDSLALFRALCEDRTLFSVQNFKSSAPKCQTTKHSDRYLSVEFEASVFTVSD